MPQLRALQFYFYFYVYDKKAYCLSPGPELQVYKFSLHSDSSL